MTDLTSAGGAGSANRMESPARRVSDRLIRRRCRALIAQMTLPQPWDLDQFVELVERSRGRRTVIEPASARMLGLLSGADHTSGMTRVETEYDLVLVLDDALPERALVILLHELAHLLCGHLMNPAAGSDRTGGVAASTGIVHAAAARSSWAAPREREAELLATMLRTYADDHPTGPEPASAVVARAATVFGLVR